jgi:hypothetical protein
MLSQQLEEMSRQYEVDEPTCPREINFVDIPQLLQTLKTDSVSIISNMAEYSAIFKASNEDGAKITRAIQEDQILKTSLKLQRNNNTLVTLPCFWDVWKTNKRFRNAVIQSANPNEEKWILSRQYSYKIATTFMPIYAKAVYEYFGNPPIVLDPCSGWGDRLLGAEIGGVQKYIGFDPNCALRLGYSKIMDLLGHSMTDLSEYHMAFSNSFEIYSKPFEQGALNIPSESVDFIFTSPPFFDYEIYSRENPTYSDWMAEFYEPLFIQCARIIKKGGYVCMYIGDTSAGKIESFLQKRVEKICPLVLEKKCIGFQGLYSGAIRKMWIFKKE